MRASFGRDHRDARRHRRARHRRTIAYVVGARRASRGRERPTVAPMFAPSFGGLQARVSF